MRPNTKQTLTQQTRNFLSFLGLIIFLLVFGKFFKIDPAAVNDFLKNVPLYLSGFLFVLLYVAGTFFIWYLKDPLKIIGAIIFGAYLSSLFIYLAELANAYIFFRLARKLGKDFVAAKISGRGKNFYEKLKDLNLGWIFLLRAVPLIPYRVLDLSFGLSKIEFRRYFSAVALASPIRIFWLQFILAALKDFPLLSGLTLENISASVGVLIVYFQNNQLIFMLSLAYCLLAALIAFKLKQK